MTWLFCFNRVDWIPFEFISDSDDFNVFESIFVFVFIADLIILFSSGFKFRKDNSCFNVSNLDLNSSNASSFVCDEIDVLVIDVIEGSSIDSIVDDVDVVDDEEYEKNKIQIIF